MKRIKSNVNIDQLLQPLPETVQQTVRGGASDYFLDLDGVKGESTSRSEPVIPVKIKHNI
ncbi:hypothetical protein IFO70_23590 [Phormidium tenue FACHB-886]|nr:hypothetical protein [Phormidium tenue FACHB-886]